MRGVEPLSKEIQPALSTYLADDLMSDYPPVCRLSGPELFYSAAAKEQLRQQFLTPDDAACRSVSSRQLTAT